MLKLQMPGIILDLICYGYIKQYEQSSSTIFCSMKSALFFKIFAAQSGDREHVFLWIKLIKLRRHLQLILTSV